MAKLRTQIINILFGRYGFESYLEIGVASPDANFNKINAVDKVSVDSRKDQGKCYTYNVTSDTYFKNYAGDRKFDVIFIDGKHTEEQVYKDARNAINHLNDNGFIVLHDCNPLTEGHIITNNGTVYKGFIRLKKELKDWSCFIIDEDEGCGIITKRKILENKILDIPVNTWDDFGNNRKELLQLVSFDEFLNVIL